jgi:hypothetical protein
MKTAILILFLLATACAMLGPRGSKTNDWQIIAAAMVIVLVGAIGFWHILNMTLK